MARNIIQKKGFTLLELILYMSICTVLVGGVLYSSFYLQEVMQYNSLEYKAKEDMYRYIILLQEYAKIATKIEVGTSSIKIFHMNGYVEHTIENTYIMVKYVHDDGSEKIFTPFPYTQFEEFLCTRLERQDTYYTKSILRIYTKRINSKNEIREMVDFLVIP